MRRRNDLDKIILNTIVGKTISETRREDVFIYIVIKLNFNKTSHKIYYY